MTDGTLHPFVDSMVVVRGDGGVCITTLTDEEAVRVFLDWLHEARTSALKDMRHRVRRRQMKIVKGKT